MDILTRLERFKIAAYRNAVRLFRDAALLFNNERYPSSFALAVYSFEELGKMHVIDRGCGMLCMNLHGAEEIYKLYFEGSWFKDHRHKQIYALWDALGVMPNKNDPIWFWVDRRGLERKKQDALYVEMGHKEIKIPASVTREKAFKMLEMSFNAFVKTGDLAFSGFDASPTSKSEWLASETKKQLKREFDQCAANNHSFRRTPHKLLRLAHFEEE